MTTTAAAFAIPAGRGEDVALVNHWLSHLAGAREIAGYEARLTTTSDGPVANYHVVQPTAAA